jgi:hypothetical protein
MQRFRTILAAAAVLAATASTPAMAQGIAMSESSLASKGALSLGPIGGIAIPTGDVSDVLSTGWMLGGQGTYGLGMLSLLGEVGVTKFGAEVDGASADAVWNFGAGARLALGPIYVGGLASYYSENVDFELVPMAGIYLGPIDIGARYVGLVSDAQWFAVTAAVHFRLR